MQNKTEVESKKFKKIRSKKNPGPRNFWGLIKNFEKHFGPKKILSEKFWVQKNVWSEKIWVLKKILGQKNLML